MTRITKTEHISPASFHLRIICCRFFFVFLSMTMKPVLRTRLSKNKNKKKQHFIFEKHEVHGILSRHSFHWNSCWTPLFLLILKLFFLLILRRIAYFALIRTIDPLNWVHFGSFHHLEHRIVNLFKTTNINRYYIDIHAYILSTVIKYLYHFIKKVKKQTTAFISNLK